MRIAIRHETTYRYAPAVQGLGLRLRLYPTALPGQRPAAWSVRAGADEVAPMLVNGFGDSEGQWFARADINLDFPAVLGLTLFSGVLIVVSNLIVDVLYALIDPRIRLE